MIIELKGTIKKIGEKKTLTDNLTICEILITITENKGFTQDIPVTLKNEKIDLVKNLQEGMAMICKCFLNGRESNGRNFIQLVGFDIISKYNND